MVDRHCATIDWAPGVTNVVATHDGNPVSFPLKVYESMCGVNGYSLVFAPATGYEFSAQPSVDGSELLNKTLTVTASDAANDEVIEVYAATSAVMHTVSKSGLDGVSSSNAAGAVQHGGQYITTLQTSDNLFVVDDDTVVVMMGGVDITSQVYSNDVINIPEVTGDIVISASAMTYVSDGLVMHLDGKNRGGVAGKWLSLVDYDDGYGFNEPIEFTLVNDTSLANYDQSKDYAEESDHVSFKGFSKGTANIDSLPIGSADGTIEVAYKNASVANNGDSQQLQSNNFEILQNTNYNYYGSSDPRSLVGPYIAFGSFYLSTVGDVTKNYITNSCTGPSNGTYYTGRFKSATMLKTSVESGGFFSLSSDMSVNVGVTNFYRNNTRFTEGDTSSRTSAVMGTGTNSRLSLMYRINASNKPHYSIGDLYSVRVYNKKLSDVERLQNYKVDCKRFPNVLSNS